MDLLPQPGARRYSDVASIDRAAHLVFNGDLPAHLDPSAASASSPLIRGDKCEALSRPPHRPGPIEPSSRRYWIPLGVWVPIVAWVDPV